MQTGPATDEALAQQVEGGDDISSLREHICSALREEPATRSADVVALVREKFKAQTEDLKKAKELLTQKD